MNLQKLFGLLAFAVLLFIQPRSGEVASFLASKPNDLNLGQKFPKKSRWFGNQVVSSAIPILILAGHADSQGMDGAGTSGEAVALKGLSPMERGISDELFWNLKLSHAIVKLGQKQGLNIRFYQPQSRTILDGNDATTNWSVGARHSQQGGYALEIHFDSYGEYGFGSGLIPPLTTHINNIDESLARTFGRYPLFFRGGLGGPRRQIRLLEIGKLEGDLENSLRTLQTREKTIQAIASRIVRAIILGINQKDSFNPELLEDDIFLPDSYL